MIEFINLNESEMATVLNEYNKIATFAYNHIDEHCDLYRDRMHYSIEFNDFGMIYINAFIDNTLSVLVSLNSNRVDEVATIACRFGGIKNEFEVRTDKHGEVIYIELDMISDFVISEFEMLK